MSVLSWNATKAPVVTFRKNVYILCLELVVSGNGFENDSYFNKVLASW